MPSALPQGYKKGYLSGYEPDKAAEQYKTSFRHHNPNVPTGGSRKLDQARQQTREQSQSRSEVSSTHFVDSEGKQKYAGWLLISILSANQK